MIVLWAGSVGCTHIAGSSAESPLCGTGSVSTVAVTVVAMVMVAARAGKATTAALSSMRTAGQKKRREETCIQTPFVWGQRLRCDSAQQGCYTERTTAQSTVRVRLCGWQGVGRFGRAKQERPAPTFCGDITSSLQPSRAAKHALTFSSLPSTHV